MILLDEFGGSRFLECEYELLALNEVIAESKRIVGGHNEY